MSEPPPRYRLHWQHKQTKRSGKTRDTFTHHEAWLWKERAKLVDESHVYWITKVVDTAPPVVVSSDRQ